MCVTSFMDDLQCYYCEPGIRLGDVDNGGVELLPLVVRITNHCTAQQQTGTRKDSVSFYNCKLQVLSQSI